MKSRAFTVIEILVVIAVAAMLVGVSFFSWRAYQKSAPLIQTLDYVEQYCALARSKAIMRQQPMDLVLLEGEIVLMSAAHAVESVNEFDEVTQNVNAAQELQRAEFSPDVTITIQEPILEDDTGEGTYVRFYPNGTSEPLQLLIEGSGGSYVVGLDPVTGRTKTVKSN